MRRSRRIQERRQKLLYALPENESDSENECDQGAKLEYEELESIEGVEGRCEDEEFVEQEGSDSENEWEDEGEECIENEDESDDEVEQIHQESGGKKSKNDDWNYNTDVLDKLNLSFEKDGCMIGKEGDIEIDFFKKIFDDAVISKVVEQTNIYARQKNSKNWTDLTPDELKAVVGIQIIMGIHKLPNIKSYWSSDPILRVNVVADTMPAKRYEKIIQNLHINDNEHVFPKAHPQYDKLHKLRPLIDLLNENIGRVYRPSSFVTIDESMIAFKGRCVLKQYMPKKPIKRGYKVWCLADAITGFIIAFVVYTGKEVRGPKRG